MRIRCVLLFLCFILWAPVAGAEEDYSFSMTAPEVVRPYDDNQLTVTLSAPGDLTVKWSMDGQTGTVANGLILPAGTHSIVWNALGAHDEPLPGGAVFFSAAVAGMRIPMATAQARVGTPVAAVQFAVASSDMVYPGNPHDFHVYYQLSRAGTLRAALADASGTPLRTWNLKREDTQAHIFRFDGTVNGKTLSPGKYSLSFQANQAQTPIVLPFVMADQSAEAPPVAPTGPQGFLPATQEDADIWAALMTPLTVIDIGATSHQAIKDAGGNPVGSVHGQSAGLMVHNVDDGGLARVGVWRTEDGQYVEGYVPVGKLKVIAPNRRFGVVIDKHAQTLAVYENGTKLGSMAISTGLPTPGAPFRETPAGAYLTEKRISAFTSEGYRYEYPIRIDGGNLLHQIGWTRQGGFADHEAQLGMKASHGCVRIPHTGQEGALNAYWLWANLPTGTKVLVLDGRDAPAAAERAVPQPVIDPDESVRKVVMTFGGDTVLGSEESKRRRQDSFDSVVAAQGYGWPFALLQPIFAKDDVTMINLEGVLKDNSANMQERLYNFRGPEAFAGILPASSIEIVNIANNHHIDYGSAGRKSTTAALDDAGVAYAGYGHLYVWQRDGIRIGFGGIRETTWLKSRQTMAEDIASLKAQGCDLIIYSCHFGKEYDPIHNDLQAQIARQAIDEGADIVIGHHPHVVQGAEHYKGGVIFYSLGNLVFGGNLKLTEFDACLVQAVFTFTGNECTSAVFELIPVLTSGTVPANDFRPLPAQGEDRMRILSKVQQDSALALMDGILAFDRSLVSGFMHGHTQAAYVVDTE